MWGWLFRLLGGEREVARRVELTKAISTYTAKERCEINYGLGSKWIIRSNEPDPLICGVVVGYHQMFDQWFPIFLADGEEIFTMSVVSSYSPQRWEALQKLEWWEQYNVMNHWAGGLTKKDASIREEARRGKVA